MKFWLAAFAVLILAAWLRICRLDIRPMHGDEAVHAYKLGQLLEDGFYRYDPREFHGPTLNYFTLLPAWLTGRTDYASLNEWTLRIVPVFFGLLLVAMTLLLTPALGRAVALLAAGFTAVSPAFVFYSRYYIQEMLLVCFTFGLITSAYRYAQSRKALWVVLAGVSAGLCHATKETCIIAFAAMVVATLLALQISRRSPTAAFNALAAIKPTHLVVAVVAALVVSGLFFSSFLTNPSGLIDSFRTYATYFDRAARNPFHIHPWYYYLKLLIYTKCSTGPAWTEMFIVLLAALGVAAALLRKGVSGLDTDLLDFLVFYTLIMLAAYSAIPYKTPWCLLSFYHGVILLAAVGAVAVLKLLVRMSARLIVGAFFATAAADLLLQAFLASLVAYADTSNPYVYAQPTPDVLEIAQRIEQVSQVYPAPADMPIIVVCPDDDYWPLPWYLRAFNNVGWWSNVAQIQAVAPVALASPQLEADLITRLFELSPPGQKNLYVPLFDKYLELRPMVELRGYVTKDLLDRYRRLTAPADVPPDANNPPPAGR